MTAADEPAAGQPSSGETRKGEQQLILEARAGSHTAFRCLVERYMRQTYNVAFGFVRDHDHAEEVTQEVFVKAHAALSSFRGDAEFGTWLYRIATNLSLNHIKQQKRHEGRKVNTADAMNEAVNPHHDEIEVGERRAHIERAIHELPTLQRAVVILRHIDGLSTRQVSAILKCSEGTVKTHLFRGLKKLKAKLVFLQEGRI